MNNRFAFALTFLTATVLGAVAPSLDPAAMVCGQAAAAPSPPKPPGPPTARFCTLRDLGTPSAADRRRTEDPIWMSGIDGLALGPDGNIYSTSPSGGKYSRGVAFKITPQGAITVFHHFDGGLKGGGPMGGLTYGGDGYFYGTTRGGGNFKVGTIFRIPAGGGAPQTLFSFRNGWTRGLLRPCPDQRCPYTPRQRADAAGSYANSAPVRDAGGVLYGVTPYSYNQQGGTLYRFAPPYDSTSFQTLCIFDPRLSRDTTMAKYVCDPQATRPVMVTLGDGGSNLYGVTFAGYGTVFKATLGGKLTILHQFDVGAVNGIMPYSVMQASDGQLYGTTAAGGRGNIGTVYRMDTGGGNFRLLTSMQFGSFSAGVAPNTGLVEGRDSTGNSDGHLYGATRFGGRGGGRGILYRIKMNGDSLKVLHDFVLYATGRSPTTAPIQLPDGRFYGFTSQGGVRDKGAFYRLDKVDYPELSTRPGKFYPGVTVFRDTLILIQKHVRGLTASGTIVDDGIRVSLTCRNPHFVQFIYREKITTLGYRIPGTFSPSSGSYPFTTDSSHPNWHSDATGKPNAYFDEGPGSAHNTYQTGFKAVLTIFDAPNFPATGKVGNAVVSLYDPADQSDPATGQVWRTTAKEYAICNCEVVREIGWTLEKVPGKKQDYTNIKVLPANNSALAWINDQLVKDGFDPVP